MNLATHSLRISNLDEVHLRIHGDIEGIWWRNGGTWKKMKMKKREQRGIDDPNMKDERKCEKMKDAENECELGFYSSQSLLSDNSNAPL